MDTQVPFFSVISSTHLRAGLLRRALRSIRAQSFSNLEIIVVADVMDADTGAAVAELLGKNDVFIKQNGGEGPAYSRNAGIQAARGEWVVFLDDDDSFRPHHLQVMHDHAVRTEQHVLYSDYEVVTEDRSLPRAEPVAQGPVSLAAIPAQTVYVKNFIPNNVLAYRRGVLAGAQVDAHLASLEDWDFLLGVCARAMPVYVPGGGAVVHKDYVNPGFRRGTQESSNNATVLADFLHVYRRWPAPTPALKQARQELLQMHGLGLPVDWF